MPTYNFANVVDDHLMKITHVIRGSEYLSSTPKYNLLYDAFGWERPCYVHCSPVMKNATTKFSKRNGDATFEDLLNQGFLPEAVVNYVALLGWSPKCEQEIFSLKQLEKVFDVGGIVKSPAIFDFNKLLAVNAVYLKKLSDDEFLNLAKPYIKEVVKSEIDLNFLVKMLKTRISVFGEIKNQLDFIDFLPEFDLNLFIHKKMKTNLELSLQVLEEVLIVFKKMDSFKFNDVHSAVFELIEKLGLKNGQVLWPIRTAVSGKQFTPGGGVDLVCLLGKFKTVERIQMAIDRLKQVV